jgi:hypothetical protein
MLILRFRTDHSVVTLEPIPELPIGGAEPLRLKFLSVCLKKRCE